MYALVALEGGVGDGDGDEQMDEFEESMGDDADEDEDVECGDERLDAKRDTFGFAFDEEEGGGRGGGGGDDFIMDDVRDAIDASNSLFMFISS